MADGLLTQGLNYIDQQKQALAARLGLLMNNPQEFAAQLGSEARQRAGVGLLGEPKTAQEMASGSWINTPYGQNAMDQASGFAGTTIGKPLSNVFNIIKRDASDIFGAGAEKIRYTDPKSGGTIEILSKPDKTASVLSLEVPEQFRGKKIGESLQARVMQDFPEMQGQVSSKAAAKTAYRLGRRPVGQPNATLDDVFKAIDEDSSVNLVSPNMQRRFALDIASQNAEKMLGLPKGNTPMDRAKALGYDIPVYHGSTVNFRIPERDVFVSEAPSIANRYAFKNTEENSLVMPMLIKGNTPKFEHLNANSYRVTPENVRSKFAAFDPARVNEPDLLAAGVPLGLLAGTNIEMPKKEKRK